METCLLPLLFLSLLKNKTIKSLHDTKIFVKKPIWVGQKVSSVSYVRGAVAFDGRSLETTVWRGPVLKWKHILGFHLQGFPELLL